MWPSWLLPPPPTDGVGRIVLNLDKRNPLAERIDREIETLQSVQKREKCRQAKLSAIRKKAAETKRRQYASKRQAERKDWWKKYLD